MPNVQCSTSSRPCHAHFVVRITWGADVETISGLAERLGSGEKERFESAADLLRLLTRRPDQLA